MSELVKKSEGWRDRAIKELRSPIVAFSLIISMLTTIPTVYGWLFPGETTLVLVHYDPFVVYDPGRPLGERVRITAPPGRDFHPIIPTMLPDPPLKVLAPDGTLITSRVLDLEVSIWNGGSESVGRDKLRRPVVMTFPVDALLGIRVLHENKNDGLKVNDLHTSPASVEISWDYMDPGRGFKFAVIFAEQGVLTPIAISSYVTGRVVDTNRELPVASWRNVLTIGGLLIIMFLGSIALFGQFGIIALTPVLIVLIPLILVLAARSESPPF